MAPYTKHIIRTFILVIIGIGMMWYFPDMLPVHKGKAVGMLLLSIGVMYGLGIGVFILFKYFNDNLWNR